MIEIGGGAGGMQGSAARPVRSVGADQLLPAPAQLVTLEGRAASSSSRRAPWVSADLTAGAAAANAGPAETATNMAARAPAAACWKEPAVSWASLQPIGDEEGPDRAVRAPTKRERACKCERH